MDLFSDIILALRAHGARLTGSWARGEERLDSDYDFYVPERRWKDFVKAAPGGWESCIVGHVAWRVGGDLIEASSLFRRTPRKKKLVSRVLFTYEWRTH